jgi:hypothetical protein
VLEQNVQPWHVRSHEKHGKKILEISSCNSKQVEERLKKKRTCNMFISFVHKSLNFNTTLKSEEIQQRYIMSPCECGAANN